ncbi:TetR/AcrR family transcriptional regulator [Pelagibius litoralis]|uniref:TetR/AcrR family transcriptional regulator n=1 Tax=Pelagibius litoralis TaxID=374515 RepID=A0A967C1S9_9PROT|nr:TetR/AcrR family transcriptional regulator [Pelagibius litoralis]NIA67936.1 TetR/AcrR family transcriptional regulator [Pelagibius litoralis]
MTVKKTKPTRGRPRAFDPEAAVETALALFHERGYDAVGVAELSQATGVKPPSLYAAFGSKQGLFERAVALYRSRDGAVIQAALAEEGRVDAVIPRLFIRAAEAYSADPGRPGCLILDGARNSADPSVCAFMARLKAASRQGIVDRLRRDLPERDYPGGAGRLADFVGVVLAGLSAAARDGMPREALIEAAALAGTGFRAACPDSPG